MNKIRDWFHVRINDIKRLHQCITCESEPLGCGCTEKEEDESGMCIFYKDGRKKRVSKRE